MNKNQSAAEDLDLLVSTIDESLRRRFESAWAQGEPLCIGSCLPRRDSPQYVSTLEELVHIDIEFAWKRWFDKSSSARHSGDADSPRRVEHYVQEFVDLRQKEIVGRLIDHEYLVRSKLHDRPDKLEFVTRYVAILVEMRDSSAKSGSAAAASTAP